MILVLHDLISHFIDYGDSSPVRWPGPVESRRKSTAAEMEDGGAAECWGERMAIRWKTSRNRQFADAGVMTGKRGFG